jgi:putative tryptophan/tyrosine transport system substrate-binding protein
MRRREFIAGLGSAAVWPGMTRAQRATMPTIGFLSTGSATSIVPFVAGFHRGLGAAGFAEGKNVAVEYRWADNQYDRLPTLAAELVARPVSVIVTGGSTAATLAAKAATSTIPIVFTIGGDPVKFGLVDSMNRPSGNVTGVSFLSNVLATKHMQLLQALLPASSAIGVLLNPNNANAASDAVKVQEAAASLRLQVQIVNATAESDIDAAFDNLARARSAALLVFPDTLFLGMRERLVGIAAARKLPALYSNRVYVEGGGLMSYGSRAIEAYREAGIYTGRILRGEKPSDLPVVQSDRFELVINLKTANALGLTIPEPLLATADEVIQ